MKKYLSGKYRIKQNTNKTLLISEKRESMAKFYINLEFYNTISIIFLLPGEWLYGIFFFFLVQVNWWQMFSVFVDLKIFILPFNFFFHF